MMESAGGKWADNSLDDDDDGKASGQWAGAFARRNMLFGVYDPLTLVSGLSTKECTS